MPRPRVGYVGGLDRHTFDPELLVDVARRLPDVGFLLVGPSTLPEGWCPLPNVTQLGQRPYEQVAGYMAACDVLIMPWNRSPWIEACNPIKLKEYLAVGRPVVSAPFAELRRYSPLVRVAAGAAPSRPRSAPRSPSPTAPRPAARGSSARPGTRRRRTCSRS